MNLDELRKQIDETDNQLVKLLNQRAQYAQAIGKIKSEGAATPVYSPGREAQIHRKILALSQGPLDEKALLAIYREIISASRALEKPLNIAYWGPEGTNTHLAAIRRFGTSCLFEPCETIDEIFSAVEKGLADFGVVPVENSTDGVITHTLDVLSQSSLKICAEVHLEISHHLLSHSKELSEIRRVYSIPTATAQCRGWLRKNLPGVEITSIVTTAAAARQAASEPGTAAIANELAAELYNLEILRERIEDSSFNRTRFLIVGRKESEPTGKDKTSIVFSVKHIAGALYKALATFAERKINMTLIESRPTKMTPWEYNFFMDFQGHSSDPQISEALAEFEKFCTSLRVLGSYPEVD